MASRIASIFRKKDREPDHHEVRVLSSDYIDGKMDEARIGQVKPHLKKCGPCNTFVRTIQVTVNLLRSTPKLPAPDGFLSRVRDSLPQDPSD